MTKTLKWTVDEVMALSEGADKSRQYATWADDMAKAAEAEFKTALKVVAEAYPLTLWFVCNRDRYKPAL